MATSSNAGDKLFIATGGTANSSPANQAAWEALTWTEVKEVMEIGPYGDTVNIISYKTLGDGRVKKLTGTADAGNVSVKVAADPLDPGQIALSAGQAQKFTYLFKRELNDAADSNDPKSVHYFGAKIGGGEFGATSEGGDAVRTRDFSLAITTPILNVATVATP